MPQHDLPELPRDPLADRSPDQRADRPPDQVADRPPDQLADRLHSAAIHLLRRVATVDAGSGLSPARLSALSVIVYGGPMAMSELARTERVSPATITSTVSGLESTGLVTRRRESTDARSVTVEATTKGREVLVEGRRRRVAVLAEALGALSGADRTSLAKGLDALEKLLGRPHR